MIDGLRARPDTSTLAADDSSDRAIAEMIIDSSTHAVQDRNLGR